MLRQGFIAASRASFNALYRLWSVDERENLAVFLSRQTDEPSYDYAELARELESRGWTCVMHLKKVRARNIVSYVAHVLRELRLLGRCKLAVLDRYDPVVCLLHFDCDDFDAQSEHEPSSPVRHNTTFPRKPTVLQIWHAFGAYKKFGFQSVGTLEGHSADFTFDYDIHRNYSWVLCSGEGARDAFAEAFSCPRTRVVPLVRPEFDELLAARASRERRASDGRRCAPEAPLKVLMAPTLRKSSVSAHPFKDLYEARNEFSAGLHAEFSWSFHPLEQGLPAPGNVSERLLDADCLVTDYSSIAYEACLLGIPVLFHVPDIESYRLSPGLNADPATICPKLCTSSADELRSALSALADGPGSYDFASLARFAATGFDEGCEHLPGTAASRIVDFALDQISQRP